MNPEFIPLKKCFEKHNWSWQEEENVLKNIKHIQKNNMHLYNYNDSVLVERNNPVIMKCRGLVVNDEGKIMNYPFERFFNHFEKEKAEINFNECRIEEK